MKHRSIEDVTKVTRVHCERAREYRLSRRERLHRLSEVMDRFQGPLSLLSRVEHLTGSEHMRLRVDHSPLSVAFEDPMLRAEGLGDDRLGDAIRFFQLTQWQAHELFCECHSSQPVTPAEIANRARVIARQQSVGELWEGANDVRDGVGPLAWLIQALS